MKYATKHHGTFDSRTLFRQRGASLLEAIAYLGIAAVIILGAVSLLSGAFGSAQSNRATEEIVSLRTAAKKLYSGQTYPAGMAPAMIAARAVPGTLNVNTANSTISNSWGGAVTVVGNAGAGGVNSFTITYNAVPQDACINILSGASGWSQVSVGNTNLATSPVTTAEATANCTGATNTIAFVAS